MDFSLSPCCNLFRLVRSEPSNCTSRHKKVRPQTGRERKQDASTPVSQGFASHGSSLKRFIGRLVRGSSDIEDIAQEAFLCACAVERSWPVEQSRSFLFRIAKHVALSQLSRKSTDCIDESWIIDAESSAEDVISARQVLGLHCEAVAELPPQCRQVDPAAARVSQGRGWRRQ